MAKVTKVQAEKALQLVAEWLGPKMGSGHGCGECADCTHGLEIACEKWKSTPAPTGDEAAAHALGPHLTMDWDWPSSGPTPTILLEGGPYDWAVDVSLDDQMILALERIDVFAEPYAGYALCLYRLVE